jgi:hypothetical protein
LFTQFHHWSFAMVTFFETLLGLGWAAWYRGTLDAYHVVAGAVLLALLVAAVRIVGRLWHGPDAESELDDGLLDEPDSIVRRLFMGTVRGLALAASSAALMGYIGFPVIETIPLYAAYYDRDRAEFEQRLRILETAGDYAQASDLLGRRLRRRASDAWRNMLIRNLCDDLTRASQQSPDLDRRITLLRQASTLAGENGLDDRLIKELLDQAVDVRDGDKRIDDLRQRKQWTDLVKELRSRLDRKGIPAADPDRLAARLQEALISSALESESLDRKVALLREARDVVQRYRLHSDYAVLLKDAETRLARSAEIQGAAREHRAHKRWRELIALIEQARHELVRSEWTEPYDRWLFDAYLLSGDEQADAATRVKMYESALAVASEYGLEAQPATSRIGALKRDRATSDALAAQVRDLRHQGDFPSLIAVLKVGMAERPRPQWALPFDRMLIEAYLDWAGTQPDLDARAKTLRKALEAAREHHGDIGAVASRLETVERELATMRKLELERNRPASLPRGAQGHILRTAIDQFPPVLIVDYAVEDAMTKPITGLARKDFRVTVAGRGPRHLGLGLVTPPVQSLNIVLALDISASVTGPAFDLSRQGARAFLAGIAGPDREVRILAFNHVVYSVTPWTADFHQAGIQLGSLAAAGNTALLQAILQAAVDCRQRKGERCLVLFTDGRNSVVGTELDVVLRRCREERLVVHCVGLRTAELDLDLLQRLARETGGTCFVASRPEEIAEQFHRASKAVRRNFYRLAIEPEPGRVAGPLPVEIRVGGENDLRSAIVLDLDQPGGLVSAPLPGMARTP